MIALVKPSSGIKFKVKQSRNKVLVGVEPCRCIVLGGSGAGKDVMLTSWFTDIMRGAYLKILWFSPSCDIDHQLAPSDNMSAITYTGTKGRMGLGATRSGMSLSGGESWTSRKKKLRN